MAYRSENPYNGKLLKSFDELTDSELAGKLELSHKAFHTWQELTLDERLNYLPKLSDCLSVQLEQHGSLISAEMGKPIKQSLAEIEKCRLTCDYYYKNAAELLKPENHDSNANESYVVFQPTGIIYGIMPWNFPYWQVFRFLLPNLIVGNGVLLKHASNVPQCAQGIETLLADAGFPEGIFQNLFINYEQSEWLIGHEYITGVSFTGSEAAGSRVASLSGKHIKKTVLELGGSDPFIVLKDADLEKLTDQAVFARMQNAGQSCIAAKRFFVQNEVYAEFLEKFTNKVEQLKLGDPFNMDTDMGPMASESLLSELDMQVKKSILNGGRLITGGKRHQEGSLLYEPTIITTSNMDIPVCTEETFGPVAVVIGFSDIDDVIQMANSSCFGLGASVWSKNINLAKEVALKIESGMVTINGIVKSDPALPFGGTKKSGYGRELAAIGFKEFSNQKTITIHYIN